MNKQSPITRNYRFREYVCLVSDTNNRALQTEYIIKEKGWF